MKHIEKLNLVVICKKLLEKISITGKRINRLEKRTENIRPTRTFPEYFEFIKKLDFYPGTVIDVGAARGTPPLHDAFPNAYFILFEPLKDFLPQLNTLLTKYSGEVHNCALMSSEGERKILKSPDLYGSSLMHTITKNLPKLVDVKIEVLDKVLDGNNYAEPYLLKIDCQGSDLEVIKGATETLKKCEVVILEASFFRFWGEHHPDFLEILNYMREKGFVVHDLLDGLYRPYDKALGQIDVVFVKKNGMFRVSSQWVPKV